MNGTSGMRLKMAQATFGTLAMSRLVSKSIQISTTAIGCRKQISNSIIFFTP
jgi:hypothetical protein